MSELYTTLFGQTKHVNLVNVCSTSTAVTPGLGTILMPSANVGMSASESTFEALS